MRNVIVAEIMTREPITIKKETNLLECARQMIKKKVGSLLIVDEKRLVGFISKRDILWALVKKSKKDLSSIKAIDISPKKVVTIKPSATIKEALNKMKKMKVDKLPVIQEKELVGMLTFKDILSFNPEYYPELEEFAQIREETQKLKRVEDSKLKKSTEGICSECGNFGILVRFNGMNICPSCAESM